MANFKHQFERLAGSSRCRVCNDYENSYFHLEYGHDAVVDCQNVMSENTRLKDELSSLQRMRTQIRDLTGAKEGRPTRMAVQSVVNELSSTKTELERTQETVKKIVDTILSAYKNVSYMPPGFTAEEIALTVVSDLEHSRNANRVLREQIAEVEKRNEELRDQLIECERSAGGVAAKARIELLEKQVRINQEALENAVEEVERRKFVSINDQKLIESLTTGNNILTADLVEMRERAFNLTGELNDARLELTKLEDLKPEPHGHMTLHESMRMLVSLFKDVQSSHSVLSNAHLGEPLHGENLPARIRSLIDYTKKLKERVTANPVPVSGTKIVQVRVNGNIETIDIVKE